MAIFEESGVWLPQEGQTDHQIAHKGGHVFGSDGVHHTQPKAKKDRFPQVIHQFMKSSLQSYSFSVIALIECYLLTVGDQPGMHISEFPFQLLFFSRQIAHGGT